MVIDTSSSPAPAQGAAAPAPSRADRRHLVALLVRDGLLPIEAGIVHRIFGTARAEDGGAPLYSVVTCTPNPGEVRTDTDFTINVTRGLDVLAEADTVVIPASDADYEPSGGPLAGPLADAIRRIRPGARIASICSGAFVLAAAGLLDGRRATTHWRSAEALTALYPSVQVDCGVLYTDDRGVLTAAGVASGIDLCLHMVRSDHGLAVANAVARSTVVAPHRDGGQAQFVRTPVPRTSGPAGSATGRAREWALARLDGPLPLALLAEQAGLSVRSFTRRFREEAGVSPARWILDRRLDRARELLETTDLPVDSVAVRAGLGTATSLRTHLHAALGVTPSAYRRTFRGTASPAAAA
ncbi:GlxA family transcriptional regulator [Nocardiopsis coralliicola]